MKYENNIIGIRNITNRLARWQDRFSPCSALLRANIGITMMEMAERRHWKPWLPCLPPYLFPEHKNKLILKQYTTDYMRRFCVFPLGGCLHGLHGSVVSLPLGSGESVALRLMVHLTLLLFSPTPCSLQVPVMILLSI